MSAHCVAPCGCKVIYFSAARSASAKECDFFRSALPQALAEDMGARKKAPYLYEYKIMSKRYYLLTYLAWNSSSVAVRYSMPSIKPIIEGIPVQQNTICLLYTSDAADDL